MTEPVKSLPATVLHEATAAASWQEAAYGTDPKAALAMAGIPLTGRALVVIGFQGCGSHKFDELETLAKQNNAILYVINGWPGSPDPNIYIDGRKLEGTVVSPAARNNTPDKIYEIGTMLGLLSRIQGQGSEKAVISSGRVLLENGEPIKIREQPSANLVRNAPRRA